MKNIYIGIKDWEANVKSCNSDKIYLVLSLIVHDGSVQDCSKALVFLQSWAKPSISMYC